MSLKASGEKGRAKPLAAAIAGKLGSGDDNFFVEAVGASAISNAVKAIAIANTMLWQSGETFRASAMPEFRNRSDGKGREFTLIRFRILKVRREDD